MKLVTIKRYSSAVSANIDAAMLRSNGIECAVDGENTSTILPYLPQVVELVVREEDQQQACYLLGIEGE